LDILILVYSYLIICVSMILFNIYCAVAIRYREKSRSKRSVKMYNEIKCQMDEIAISKPVCMYHEKYLKRTLVHVGNLLVFDRALERAFQDKPELAQEYIKEIYSVFIHLGFEYLEKDSIKAAYLAHVLGKYRIAKDLPIDPIGEVMLAYLKFDSIYTRQNTLKALISFGNEEKVLLALKIIDRRKLYIHGKLLTNMLIEFTGDHENLTRILYDNLDGFSDEIKLVILNYIRFVSSSYNEEMLGILKDESVNKELHFSAIRYFGRHAYKPSLPLLINFVKNSEDNWEYAAISAVSLGSYREQESIDALKQALKSTNWHVRYNAAKSLKSLGVEYLNLIDIINGYDKYAREMLMYRIETNISNGNSKVVN
jgi:hypothetical protein